MKNILEKIKKYCPKTSFVLFCICIFAAIIHITCILSETFADFYNQTLGAFVRSCLSYLTYLLPFSLAEAIIIGIPAIVFILIWVNVRQTKKGDTEAVRCLVAMVSVLSLMYSIFVLGYGMGYHGTALSQKLGLEEKAVSSDELKNTAEAILSEMTPLLNEIAFTENGESVMPYSLDEMNTKLNDTYKKAVQKYTFVQNLRSRIKYIALSEPMTYTHISGVYSYYTGEANLNINFPDYNLPYTAAHELAHQRGIAPENEANFVAFLVCMESDDIYIKYSAYMNMFEYVVNALYSADAEKYSEVISETDVRIRKEMISYNAFFEKYRESVASDVSGAVNDTYLKSQGQKDGTKSYGMVVDLAVAYYKQKAE